MARAIAIAGGLPYAEVRARLAAGMGSQRRSRREVRRGIKRAASAFNGVTTSRKWFKDYMQSLGFVWTATMRIGSGCKVHLDPDELPTGRLVVAVSKHYVAVVDGIVHDLYDPSRDGRRCVYGYWKKHDVVS